ncbi:hypothetical protein IL306_003240 [Fusarium sp. DS 682]|nr:hypothetical protein IL306_003240 [Fusarium sp. DS 682]
MRVLSFALALFAADMVVEAGVCKPARTTTSGAASTSIVESSTATVPATSTETTEVSVTDSLTSATETLSTDSSIETLTSTTLDETTSTEVVSTTTTEEASTTTTAGPSATPGSIVGSGPVADLTLHGGGDRYVPLSFTSSDSTQTLIFTLASNGQLATGNNNNYLCLTYNAQGVLGPLVLCPFDNFQSAPLKCQRSSSGVLSCTAPNGSCTSGTCRRPNNATPFSQFYVDDAQDGYFGPADGNFGVGFTAIDATLAG